MLLKYISFSWLTLLNVYIDTAFGFMYIGFSYSWKDDSLIQSANIIHSSELDLTFH